MKDCNVYKRTHDGPATILVAGRNRRYIKNKTSKINDRNLQGDIKMGAEVAAAATIGAITGGAQIAGSGIASDQSYEMNRRLQKHDQEFQRDMRATAYQTAVTDMKKAGLNPGAIYGAGGGDTMGGSSSASAGSVSNPLGNIGSLLEAGGATALLEAQKDKLNAETGKTKAETTTEDILRNAKKNLLNAQTEKEKAITQTELVKQLNLNFDAQMKKMDVSKRNNQYDKELQIYKAQVQAEMIEAGYDASTTAQVIKAIGKTVQAISPLTGLTGRSLSDQKNYAYVTTY